NMTSLVAASFFAAATAAVLAEASLEFLGLGNPNTVSWGTILYYAQQQNALLTGQWLLVLAPGLAIALLATSFTLINFGVAALPTPPRRENGCHGGTPAQSTSPTTPAKVRGSGRYAPSPSTPGGASSWVWAASPAGASRRWAPHCPACGPRRPGCRHRP